MTELLPGLVVSRETEVMLDDFLAQVARWTKKINLVSRGTVDDLRDRHLLDSAQLFSHLRPTDTSWVDLGSGGGFPGLVVAILAREARPDLRLTLVESDRRKATFLRMMAVEMRLSVEVRASRIDDVAPLGADVVSARALAPLGVLLGMAKRQLAPDGTALFLKGESYRDEIATARQTWHFDVEEIPSVTQNAAALLKIKDIRRA
jgi:16S rRNA (guanine527-N7)-methyltransferase